MENTVATKQLEKYIPDKTEMITQDVVDAATQLKEELAPYKVTKGMMRTIDINKTKERKARVEKLLAYKEWLGEQPQKLGT